VKIQSLTRGGKVVNYSALYDSCMNDAPSVLKYVLEPIRSSYNTEC